MSETPTAPVVGRTYALSESDYRYGRGPLVCTVVRVVQLVDYYADGGRVEPWWLIDGFCRNPELVGLGAERALYVRAASLRVARGGTPTGVPPRGSPYD